MTKINEKAQVCFALRLSIEQRKKLKMLCVKSEVSMNQKIVDLIEKELKIKS